MTILIVRPEPAATELCQQLLQQNMNALALPLLQFTAGAQLTNIKQQLQQLVAGDIIICVSQQVVTQLNKASINIAEQCPAQGQYFAIGAATAKAFESLIKQKVDYPDQENSEGLISLPQFKNLKNKRIVILRGDSGRELIAQYCHEQGASVSYCEIYQRQWIQYNWHKLYQKWRHQNVTHLIVTSGQQFEYLNNHIPTAAQSWFHGLTLYAINERMVEQALTFGFKIENIKQINHIDNQRLLHAMVNM